MRSTLGRYAIARNAVVAALAVVAFVAWDVFQIHVPLAPVAAILVLTVLVNGALRARLRHARPVSERELFSHTLVDVTALTALLYFTGGTHNPLVYGFLLLVLYAATVLPQRYGWTLAAICVACYSALSVRYVPLPLADSAASHASLDEAAHWAMYVMLAGLVAWFGLRLNELRREHYRHLEVEAEDAARERYLLGLATLAAGTAHEMGTPLSTMSVVVGDLRRSPAPPADWKDSIDMLWQQIQTCKRSLAELAKASDLDELGKPREEGARKFVQDVVERFRILHPQVSLTLYYEPADETLALRVDHMLQQALLSLVNNAAEASPESVELRVTADGESLEIQILDRGPGIAPRLRERLGRGPVGPRRGGHGLGVLIANSAVERRGGSVRLLDREGGGTCVSVVLPVLRGSAPANDPVVKASHAAG